jgi:hypothetical protein
MNKEQFKNFQLRMFAGLLSTIPFAIVIGMDLTAKIYDLNFNMNKFLFVCFIELLFIVIFYLNLQDFKKKFVK